MHIDSEFAGRTLDAPSGVWDKLCCARIKSQHCLLCPHHGRKGKFGVCTASLYRDIAALAKAECGCSPGEPGKLNYHAVKRRFVTLSWIREDVLFCKALNRQLSLTHRILRKIATFF